MTISRRTKLVYVTSSQFKEAENRVMCESCKLTDGTLIGDAFTFEFRKDPVLQILEVDIEKMVREGVAKAYSRTKVPCVVEYAGLVFEKYRGLSYPGGLTKAMWNTLGENFLTETNSAGERAIARAVVGYCDGLQIRTFVGETEGTLTNAPRGERQFYWDTVFMPDDPSGKVVNKTYSEIVESPVLGLAYKLVNFSQSVRAMVQLLDFIRAHPSSGLWR